MIDEPQPVFEYRPHLDGLRAVAVLLVFIFHAAPSSLRGGFIGVDVFFVLSGFLITSILLRQVDAGSASLLGFYRRRLQRLLPAAFVLLLTVVAAESIWGSVIEASTRRREVISTVFYVANWNLIDQADDYFVEGFDPSPLRHMWSLAIEEQFYLVWPIFVVVGLRLLKGRLGMFAACIASMTVISAFLMVVRFSPAEASRVYYGTDTRVFEPLAGALLAVVVHASTRSTRVSNVLRRVRSLASAATITAFVALMAVSWLFDGTNSTYFHGGAIAVTIISLVLILGTEQPGALRTVLSHRWVVALGTISYGFYLWHWPIILWLSPPNGASWTDRRVVNLLQFAATIAIAVASHRLVEQPLRRLRRPKTSSVFVAAALSMAVTTLAAFVFLTPPKLSGPSAGSTPSTGSTLSTGSTPSTGVSAAAAQDRSYEPCPDNPRPCVKFEPGDPNAPTVVLVGDSTSQAYDPALKVLAAQHGFRYVQAAVGGCPIGHLLLATGGEGERHKSSNFMCFDEIPSIYDEVLSTWDPALIIATSSNDVNQFVLEGDVIPSGTETHVEESSKAIEAAVETLTSNGANLAFIEILPRGPSVTCLDSDAPNTGTCVRPVETPDRADPYNKIYNDLAQRRDDVAGLLLLRDVICPDDVCPLAIDDVVVRYDGGHLTGTMSESLAPVLDARLRLLEIELELLAS